MGSFVSQSVPVTRSTPRSRWNWKSGDDPEPDLVVEVGRSEVQPEVVAGAGMDRARTRERRRTVNGRGRRSAGQGHGTCDGRD